MEEIVTILPLHLPGFRLHSAAVTTWEWVSASGQLREKWRKGSPLATRGCTWASKNLTPTETATLWQFSKVTRHQFPSRTVLPFDPTGICCHPLHFSSPMCWPVGTAQVLVSHPRGHWLQGCTCLVNHDRRLSRQVHCAVHGLTRHPWQVHYFRGLYQGKTPHPKLSVPLLG